MAVHCEKFDEKRAERVIKNSVQKIKCYLRFKDLFSIVPTGSGNALFRLPFFI